MSDLVKMYRIMDGERVSALMPVGSVNRALQKGFMLEESAQKLEMPAEIVQIMKANKAGRVEVKQEVEQIKVVESEQPKVDQPEQTKPTGRPKRK